MKTLFYASCCALLLSAPAMGQKDACRFETDTSQPLQTIDGFGASDAWSMQYVGIWADSVRRQAADWLFSRKNDSNGRPLGIGLSIWRFNIGTGSAEQGEESGIGSPWMRTERLLTPDGAFDPTRQRGQRNILQIANIDMLRADHADDFSGRQDEVHIRIARILHARDRDLMFFRNTRHDRDVIDL